MDIKKTLELQLEIVEDFLGKLSGRLQKLVKEIYVIEKKNRRRKELGRSPLPELSDEEKESFERESKALRNVMAVLRVEWTNITTQLKKYKEV